MTCRPRTTAQLERSGSGELASRTMSSRISSVGTSPDWVEGEPSTENVRTSDSSSVSALTIAISVGERQPRSRIWSCSPTPRRMVRARVARTAESWRTIRDSTTTSLPGRSMAAANREPSRETRKSITRSPVIPGTRTGTRRLPTM